MPHEPRSALEKSLVGPAGEHYVLYQLYRRGFLASLAPPGTPEVDVLVLSTDGERIAATIQVKTRTRGRAGGWQLNVKHESIIEDRLLYAFVDMEPEHPVTFIVPSGVVARTVKKSHAIWLATPGRSGQPHNDNQMRNLRPSYPYAVPGCEPGWMEPYQEAWESLGGTEATA
jgi:hypothetical protein